MFKKILAAFAIACAAVSVSATTITFDDLAPAAGSLLVDNGYASFDWDNFRVVDPVYSGLFGNGVVSPHNVAYNNFAQPASFSSSTAFTLNSLYLTRAFEDGYTRFEGFNGVTSMFVLDVFATTTAPVLVNFDDWSGLTRVVMTTLGGDLSYAVLDDITVSAAVSAVPLPAGILLFGSGLLGMLGLGRKKQAV